MRHLWSRICFCAGAQLSLQDQARHACAAIGVPDERRHLPGMRHQVWLGLAAPSSPLRPESWSQPLLARDSCTPARVSEVFGQRARRQRGGLEDSAPRGAPLWPHHATGHRGGAPCERPAGRPSPPVSGHPLGGARSACHGPYAKREVDAGVSRPICEKRGGRRRVTAHLL